MRAPSGVRTAVSNLRALLHPSLPYQGREVSVFSRLWLVNRTEMVLQHREVSLAMDVDATFMGDRMPQVGGGVMTLEGFCLKGFDPRNVWYFKFGSKAVGLEGVAS